MQMEMNVQTPSTMKMFLWRYRHSENLSLLFKHTADKYEFNEQICLKRELQFIYLFCKENYSMFYSNKLPIIKKYIISD